VLDCEVHNVRPDYPTARPSLRKVILSLIVVLGVAGAEAQPARALNTDAVSANTSRAVGAQDQVDRATRLVGYMKQDRGLADLLQQSKGVFLLTRTIEHGSAVNHPSGAGLLLLNDAGFWSSPVFYAIGSVEIAARGRKPEGALALILLDEAAIDAFDESNGSRSLKDTGLRIANFAGNSVAPDDADMVLWVDGLEDQSNITVQLAGIQVDAATLEAYYGPNADARRVLSGRLKNHNTDALTAVIRGETGSLCAARAMNCPD